MMARFCGDCGKPLHEGALYCGQCGASVGAVDASHPCPHCGAANPPGGNFCGQCGHALQEDAAAPAPAMAPRTLYPTAPHAELARHHKIKPRTWLIIAVGIIAAMAVLGIVARVLETGPADACGAYCTPVPPPKLPALAPTHRYVSRTYGYSLEYGLSPTRTDSGSIGWSGTASFGEVDFKFSAQRANGRDPQSIVTSMIQSSQFSGATYVYTIPLEELGYTPGYGNVYDFQATSGQYEHLRVISIAAIKKDLAVTLFAVGSYVPDQEAHPDPAQSPVVHFFDDIANTVSWPGEAQL